MMEHEETHDGEYSRFRLQVQRGDGPDRRGKVEVELQRERPPRSERDATNVRLPDGREVRTTVAHSVFAEAVYEADRAVDLLEQQLGLDGDE